MRNIFVMDASSGTNYTCIQPPNLVGKFTGKVYDKEWNCVGSLDFSSFTRDDRDWKAYPMLIKNGYIIVNIQQRMIVWKCALRGVPGHSTCPFQANSKYSLLQKGKN